MTIDPKQVTNTKDPEFVTRMMQKSVDKCKKEDLFMPSLCLISCFIDGLGNGTKEDYIKNLETRFPDLCTQLGALIFYQKYRNGIVHEFDMKKGFGIARRSEIGDRYISEENFNGSNGKIKFLNIDLLTDDFIKWVKEIRKGVK